MLSSVGAGRALLTQICVKTPSKVYLGTFYTHTNVLVVEGQACRTSLNLGCLTKLQVARPASSLRVARCCATRI